LGRCKGGHVRAQRKATECRIQSCMSTIIMCLKCSIEITNPHAQVNLINDDFKIAFELFLFATNIMYMEHL
jgi:hypothetical protein